jgi:hypothetical protein
MNQQRKLVGAGHAQALRRCELLIREPFCGTCGHRFLDSDMVFLMKLQSGRCEARCKQHANLYVAIVKAAGLMAIQTNECPVLDVVAKTITPATTSSSTRRTGLSLRMQQVWESPKVPSQ